MHTVLLSETPKCFGAPSALGSNQRRPWPGVSRSSQAAHHPLVPRDRPSVGASRCLETVSESFTRRAGDTFRIRKGSHPELARCGAESHATSPRAGGLEQRSGRTLSLQGCAARLPARRRVRCWGTHCVRSINTPVSDSQEHGAPSRKRPSSRRSGHAQRSKTLSQTKSL